MSELERVESEIVSGAAFVKKAEESDTAFMKSAQDGGPDEIQMSAPAASETRGTAAPATRHAGRLTLRLRVRAGTRQFYRCLAAEPPASAIRWSIGRAPHTVVEGRRRLQVA
jgi:hypothetical protein